MEICLSSLNGSNFDRRIDGFWQISMQQSAGMQQTMVATVAVTSEVAAEVRMSVSEADDGLNALNGSDSAAELTDFGRF